MYALNIDNLYLWEIFRSLVFAVIFCIVVSLLSWAILRTWEKACLLSSPIILWFFSYGHIYNAVEDWQLFSIPIGRHRYLIILSVMVLVGWGFLLKSRIENAKRINTIFIVMSLVMLCYPIYTILATSRTYIRDDQLSSDSEITLHWEDSSQGPPDIYYIILDGYARADILETIYNYDNSAFIAALEDRGFYVADQSHSNYSQTLLSLASSMNFSYLDFLETELGSFSTNRSPLEELVHHSRLRQLLSTVGYSLVAYDTPLPGTTITDADYFNKTNTKALFLSLTPFEGQLANTSFLRFFIDARIFIDQEWGENVIEPGFEAHRNRTIYIFHHLPDAANYDGPQLVFAHIVAPHPPFVFGANGERLHHGATFTLKDGSYYYASREEYIQRYRDQLNYINLLTLQALDLIISSSEVPPIIIIQGDHGPGAYLDWDNIDNSNLDERFSILNAYYFPGGDNSDLYPQITPVNSFRLLFNLYFGTNLDLLPDRNYFSGWEYPYAFIEVTDRLTQ